MVWLNQPKAEGHSLFYTMKHAFLKKRRLKEKNILKLVLEEGF